MCVRIMIHYLHFCLKYVWLSWIRRQGRNPSDFPHQAVLTKKKEKHSKEKNVVFGHEM